MDASKIVDQERQEHIAMKYRQDLNKQKKDDALKSQCDYVTEKVIYMSLVSIGFLLALLTSGKVTDIIHITMIKVSAGMMVATATLGGVSILAKTLRMGFDLNDAIEKPVCFDDANDYKFIGKTPIAFAFFAQVMFVISILTLSSIFLVI